MIPDLPIWTSAPFDLIVVPGGPEARTHAFKNEVILRFVSSPHSYVMGVCPGSVILAAAGLLNNRAATAHYAHLDKLRKYPGITVKRERFVIDESNATSASVSAGIDLSLALVSARGETKSRTARPKYLSGSRPCGSEGQLGRETGDRNT